MGAALPLRGDFDAAGLRGVAKRSRDGAQSRRLLALAMGYAKLSARPRHYVQDEAALTAFKKTSLNA